jgi:hypothetical protein
MSMWRIGREAVRINDPIMTPLDRSVAYTRAATDGTGGPLGDIADTVAKWIPGEVLALYVAGVTMIGHPSWLWLVVGLLLAPLVVILSAFANSGRFPTDQKILLRANLALVAMLLWSLVVPDSGWWSWDVIERNPAAVALAGGALGLIFGLVAEGASRWVDSQPDKQPAVPSGPPNTWAPAYQPAEQPPVEVPTPAPPLDDQPVGERPPAEPPVADPPAGEEPVSPAPVSAAPGSAASAVPVEGGAADDDPTDVVRPADLVRPAGEDQTDLVRTNAADDDPTDLVRAGSGADDATEVVQPMVHIREESAVPDPRRRRR